LGGKIFFGSDFLLAKGFWGGHIIYFFCLGVGYLFMLYLTSFNLLPQNPQQLYYWLKKNKLIPIVIQFIGYSIMKGYILRKNFGGKKFFLGAIFYSQKVFGVDIINLIMYFNTIKWTLSI
jgi:hypothetical protein